MARRCTREYLDAARVKQLPDLLIPNLRVLLVGINPGLSSAASGRHFGTPGNRLWAALYRSGFTPRLLTPAEADELLELGVGITSLVRRPTARASELTKAEFVEGGRRLREAVRAYRPQWLAPLGVTGYRVAFGQPGAVVGEQPEVLGSTRIWVLPNPSGLNAHFPPLALAHEFARLRVATGIPNRSKVMTDDGLPH